MCFVHVNVLYINPCVFPIMHTIRRKHQVRQHEQENQFKITSLYVMWKRQEKFRGNPKAISIGKVELSRNHRHHHRHHACFSLGRSVGGRQSLCFCLYVADCSIPFLFCFAKQRLCLENGCMMMMGTFLTNLCTCYFAESSRLEENPYTLLYSSIKLL